MAYQAGRVDRKKVNEGVWREIMGAKWLIARAGNAKALDAYEELRKNSPKGGEEMQRKQAEIIVDGILRGWEGVEDIHGEALEFNRDNAAELLIDDPELVQEILVEARKTENFYRDDLETQKKKR